MTKTLTKIKDFSALIIISTLSVLLIIARESKCKSIQDNITEINIVDSIVYDTTIHEITQSPPEVRIIYEDNFIIDTFFQKVDTAAILAECKDIIFDYYISCEYYDTLKNDSAAFIYLQETIRRNRIENRKLIYLDNSPTKITEYTITKSENKRKFYIGPMVGGSSDNFEFGGSLLMCTKKQHYYELTYNLIDRDINFNWYYIIGRNGKNNNK